VTNKMIQIILKSN